MFFIGIDVSKKKLDVVVLLEPETLNKRQKKIPNTPEGFQTLITWCQKPTGAAPGERHAVREATGPYHEALAHALHDAGLVVSVINPKALKDFAKGLGIKAKNDAMDALTMARFGVLTQPRPWRPEPSEVRQLSALLKRLAAVETDRQRERHRLEKARLSHPSTAAVIASLARGIAFLEAEQQRLRQTLADPIDRHPQLTADRQRLPSIPGIGPVLSGLMVALWPSGHRVAAAAPFASYLGVIPTVQESGSRVRHRPPLSKRGPAGVRTTLDLAAIVACRGNPEVRTC